MHLFYRFLSFKKSLAFILLLGSTIALGCSKGSGEIVDKEPAESQSGKGQSIRVLTYNIHHANPPAHSGKIDLDAIATIIKESKADLVAVQELDSAASRSNREFQLKVLAEKTGMHYFFAKAIPYDGGGYGIGILSKYPISDLQNIPLPEDLSLGNYEDRALALVKVLLPDNRIVYFGSTHLDVNKEENRMLQAQKIVDVTAALKAPVIIAGDMNALGTSQSINLLTNYYTNASKKLEPTIPNTNPTRKIDYVFYAKHGDFTLLNEEVIRSGIASYASDHLPFVVELSLAKK
ncbi:endonuclease/exonuclease/phosphatase family protein [Desertivirga brevis]|uniref:endonuclease/exonuclease/phosphatase family protein n=1 Tax=Desertivirga brevis TaxID=2810310 RepID=UPI001A961767|nr:endonuclease/exonuclease/phosphatase family protein [Pedobacter sp. SYSU D00873]